MDMLQSSHESNALGGYPGLSKSVREIMELGNETHYLDGNTKHEDVLKWSGLVEDGARLSLVHAEMFQAAATTPKEERRRAVIESKFHIMVAVGCCKGRAHTLAKNLQRRIMAPESIARAEKAAAAAAAAFSARAIDSGAMMRRWRFLARV